MANGFGQIALPTITEIVGLSIASDQQRDLQFDEPGNQARMPERRAFRTWWQVAPGPGTRIAECRRYDCNSAFVVEHRSIQLHPFAQAVAGWIIPRHPGFMHASSRRLTDNQQSRGWQGTKNRFRPERQVLLAKPTSSSLPQNTLKVRFHARARVVRMLELRFENRTFYNDEPVAAHCIVSSRRTLP